MPDITTIPLEFMRPLWLLGLIVVAMLSLFCYQKNKKTAHQAIIAAHLSANIVTKASDSQQHSFLFYALATIACIALAGPTWRSIDMPVYEMEKAQVIVFDLSYSMYATDIKPNRLSQAKFKAMDLIKQWSEGEKAMIAYAGDAFTVTPLTRDGNAIINHIPHLSPDIMPVRGSRADLALNKAIELLENAGYAQGHIVFISDGITTKQATKMQQVLKGKNWVVSILATATSEGAPITLSDGTLLKSDSGKIVVPKLSGQAMYDIAQGSNGLYLTSRNNNSDINQLGKFFKNEQRRKSESEQQTSDQFSIDDGYWLSFLLLPLCLLLFRKGVFFALLLAVYLPFSSPPLKAAQDDVTGSVWKNSEQNAFDAYQNENYQIASELYDSPLNQGSALYKNKQYEQALEQFSKATKQQPDNANAFYNQGNSYAQLQKFDKAIEAYEQALTINPNMQQASENKGIIEQLKKQQKQQQDKKQQSDNQDKQEADQNQKEPEQQDSEQDQKASDQQNSEQQQKEDEQQESEQQQKEDEQQESEQQQKENQQQDSEQQKKEDEQQDSQQQSKENEQLEDQESKKQDEQAAQPQPSEIDDQSNEELEALPNWLKNMPDDPSILLRRKMQLEYQKRAQSLPVKQQTNNGVIW